MKLRRIICVVAVAVTAATMLAACTGKNAVDNTGNGTNEVIVPAQGKVYSASQRWAAPPLTIPLLSGHGDYSLSSDLGKVVVLNFWANWCSPCVAETPQLQLVYEAYKSKDVDFVGVDTKDVRANAQAFVQDNKITYTMVSDEEGQTAVKLGNIPDGSLPFTVLIDKQGKIADVWLGAISPNDLEPLLNKLLAET